MKIVHVCLCCAVFNEKYAYQDNLLPKHHKNLGHEVTIIAPPYLEYNAKDGGIVETLAGECVIEGGIKLIRLKQVLPCSINQHIHWFYGMGQAIKKANPDLIFVHGVSSLNYYYFKHYKRKHKDVTIVYDNHTDLNNSWHSRLAYLYNHIIVKNYVVKNIIKTSDHFYGTTPARCDFLIKMMGVPANKVSLLPMGADDEDMHFDRKLQIREEVRKQYNIKDDDFLIVTGGKIDPLKNIHVLAEAVTSIEESHIKMLVFGSIREDLKGIFQQLQSDRIQYVGWIPSNEVYRYFYAADLVMFPGLHSVLWEQAVASQVPCAFSLIKGFEHIDIGGNCILMAGKTADYYKTLVEDILKNQTQYSKLLNNSRSERTNQFLYSHIAQKVINDVNA